MACVRWHHRTVLRFRPWPSPCCCLLSNTHWNGVSRQALTARRDGNPFPGTDHHRSRCEGSFSQISMPVMAVTLLFVFDGFKDHRENKQTEQRGDDDGINHGASSKGCFRSSPALLSLCASQEIFIRAALGCCPSLIWGKEDGPAIPPLREVGSGGWLQTTWFDHSFR